MAATGLTSLVAPSIAIARALFPHLKRLHAERQAGDDSAHVDVNLLNVSFAQTLQRLAHITVDDPWWKQVLLWVEAPYITPDYLVKPSIQEWLREPAVRADFQRLASQTLLLDRHEDEPLRNRLADSYAAHTFDAAALASGTVEAVLTIMLAGTLAQLDPSARIVAGVIQHSHASILSKIDQTFSGKVHNQQKPINTAEARARIHQILPARYFALRGRQPELDRLATLFSEVGSHTGVAIVALGGMGKTALAHRFCVNREVWNSFDVVIGAQARKRQIGVSTRRARDNLIQYEEQGKDLNLQEFLIDLGRQLGVTKPNLKTVSNLEQEIAHNLKSRTALLVLDNLETATDTDGILKLIDKICVPPAHKALITTRRFPADHPSSFIPLPLYSIDDVDCRELIDDLLAQRNQRQPVPETAIQAIIAVAHGHPLSLQLLTGKLITQGAGAILDISAQWQGGSTEVLNDETVVALCEYVFNDQFMEHIGHTGELILTAIAASESGQDEEVLRLSLDVSPETFADALERLFQVNCIERELDGDYSVLIMHSITRTYFRKSLL